MSLNDSQSTVPEKETILLKRTTEATTNLGNGDGDGLGRKAAPGDAKGTKIRGISCGGSTDFAHRGFFVAALVGGVGAAGVFFVVN